MESIGYATVQLIPSFDGLENKVNSQLYPAMTGVADKAGKDSGGVFGRGFFTTVGHIMVASALYQVGQGIATGIGAGISTGLKTASFIQEAEISLETLLGSGGKAQQLFSQLTAFAAKTPFELQGVVQGTQQLLGAGSTAQQVIPTLTALGDTEAALGGSQDQFNHTLTAWTQLMTRGKIDTQDLLQISNSGIPIWQELAKALGKPVTSIQDLVASGSLLSADVLPKLQAQLEKDYGGAMSKQATTLAGVWSTVHDTITIALGQAFLPLAPWLASVLPGDAQIAANAILGISHGIQNLIADIKGLGSNTALQAFFAPFLTIGQNVIAAVQPFIGAISGAFQQMIGPLAGALPALNPLSTIFVDLMPVLPAIAGFLAQLAAGVLPAVAQALTPLADLVQAVNGAFKGLVAQVLPILAGLFSALLPVISQIVTTGFQALWQVLPSVTDVLGSLAQILGGALGTVLRTLASQVLPVLVSAFYSLAPVIGQVVKALAPLAGQIITTLATALGQLVSGALVSLVGLFTKLVPVALSVVQAFLPLIGMLVSSLLPVIQSLVTLLLPVFVSLIGSLMPVVTQLVSAFAPFIAQLVTALIPPIVQIVSTLLPALMALFQALLPILQPVISMFAQVAGIILSAVMPVFRALMPLVLTVITTIISIIKPLVQVLTGVAEFLTGVFTGDWNKAWTGIKDIFSGIWNLIVALLKGAWNIIVAAIRAGLSLIATIWRTGWSLVGTILSGIWNSFKTLMGNLIESNVIGPLRGLGGLIKGALSGAGGWLASVAQDMFNGFTGRWDNLASTIIGIVTAPFTGAVNAVKALLGINSPSRVMASLAGFTVDGWVNEFQHRAGDVRDAYGIFAAPGSLATVPQGGITGRTAAAPTAVYVQNPFTGDYLLAKTADVAGKVADAKFADQSREYGAGTIL